MREKIKKWYMYMYGAWSNVRLNVGVTCCITAIILYCIDFKYADNPEVTYFMKCWMSFISAMSLIIGMSFLRVEQKVLPGLIRILLFFSAFGLCMIYWSTVLSGRVTLTVIGSLITVFVMLLSVNYFVILITSFFIGIRRLYIVLKQRLLNTVEPARGVKAAIQDLTVFLVAIGAFTAALLTIVKTVSEIFSYILH